MTENIDSTLEPLTVGFHWQGGWRFLRREDGSVVIFNEDAPTISAIGPIPPDEWASIVHAVAHPKAEFYTVRAAIGGVPMKEDCTQYFRADDVGADDDTCPHGVGFDEPCDRCGEYVDGAP